MAVTPHDIRNTLFSTVRLRSGYEQAEVDEFLDSLDRELTALLAGSRPATARPGPGSAEESLLRMLEAPGQMFGRVRMREGYDLSQVDKFMVKVAAAFTEARSRA